MQPPYENPEVPGPPYSETLSSGVASPPPQKGPEVSFDAFTEAWTLLMGQLGVWLAAGTISTILVVGPALAIQFVMNQALEPAIQSQDFSKFPWATIALLYGMIFFFSALIHPGLTRMAIVHVRTGKTSLMEMVRGLAVLPSYVAASFLIVVMSLIGSCLCLVPGFLAMALTILAIPLIVDQRKGPVEAIKLSWEVLKPHMWMTLVFLIVCYIIAGAGGTCYIGGIITMPFFYLAIACMYRDFFIGKGPQDQTPQQPWAPIADPGG